MTRVDTSMAGSSRPYQWLYRFGRLVVQDDPDVAISISANVGEQLNLGSIGADQIHIHVGEILMIDADGYVDILDGTGKVFDQ